MPERLRRRALVVDDEALIRWSITETLHEQGFEVEQASTGEGALEAVAASKTFLDVVLLDFRLPDSNDLRLLARIRQLVPHATIILMTAFSTPEIAQGALDLGAFRVLSKPFELDDISTLVSQAR